MELQEYYVKRILKKAGLPVLKGDVAYTPAEAREIALKIGGNAFWIKPQVMSSAFHIDKENEQSEYLAQSIQEVEQKSGLIFGKNIFKENPDFSSTIQKVYIEQAVDALILFSMVIRMDFERLGITLSIKDSQNKIYSYPLDDFTISSKTHKEIIKRIGTRSPVLKKISGKIIDRSLALFKKYQMMAIEIGPVVHQGNTLSILEGRLIFDPDSLFRFPELIQCRETKLGHEREAIAKKNNFRYIAMCGNIACLVNGIGLGWATIDAIQSHHERVACLLDLGTNPTTKSVATAMRLALAEPKVDAIFVNIFGGLTSCENIAQGLLEAAKEIPIGIPVVVRLAGLKAEEAQKTLKKSIIPFVLTSKMSQSVLELEKLLKEKM